MNISKKHGTYMFIVTSAVMIYTLLIHVTTNMESDNKEQQPQYACDINNKQSFNRLNTGIPSATSPELNSKACAQPVLHPFEGEEYVKHFHSMPPIQCSEDKDWISMKNGTIFISSEAKIKHKHITCSIRYIKRRNDFGIMFDPPVTLTKYQILTMKEDFFKADCKSDNVMYSNYHAGVSYKPKIHSRVSDTEDGLGFSIFMLGFDSVSHMSFMRKLPKTYKFFKEVLQGVVLNGYNGAGDGTGENVTPILTGKKEEELPSALKNRPRSAFVDSWPFIWQNFRKKGYVTAFGCDDPKNDIYNYRLKGFNAQPTDHYMRAFYLAAIREYGKHKRLCLGSLKRNQVMFDYVRQFHEMYRTKKTFMFAFSVEFSHSNLNLVETADEDTVNLLKYYRDHGLLDNTVLMLMSDHGYRYGPARTTQQGKLEERLPYFGIHLPDNLKSKHPDILKNLNINSNRLVTPFDIHPTMHEALQSSGGGMGDLGQRGISLFKEVPASRLCKHAGIGEHYCTCIRWKKTNKNDRKIQIVSNVLVTKINHLTEKYRNLCSAFTVTNITTALTYDPIPTPAKVKVEDNVTISVSEVFQLGIQVQPASARFEGTVKWNRETNKFDITDSISRIDIYGNSTLCIEKTDRTLMKFCNCIKR